MILRRIRILGLFAVVAFVLVACDDPKDRLDSHMKKGIEFFEAENYDSARIELKNALQIDATFGEAYFYLGRVYDAQKRWPEAFRAFQQAVNQSPDHIAANVQLGRYSILAGDLPAALARAEHAVELSQEKMRRAWRYVGRFFSPRNSPTRPRWMPKRPWSWIRQTKLPQQCWPVFCA